MKITWIEKSGMGTMLNPTYRQYCREVTEIVDDHTMVVGGLTYLYRGGYVWHTVPTEDIVKIEKCEK